MRAVLELALPPRAREQALRAEEHDDHDEHAVDPDLVAGHVDVHAEVLVQPGADVREALAVQVLEEGGAEEHAPDVPHAAEDDHAEDEDRDVEVEVLREGRALEGRVVRARRRRRRTRRIAYDHVFVRISGMPIAEAAISSSRIAIHARPRRESRRRSEQKIVNPSRSSATQKKTFALPVVRKFAGRKPPVAVGRAGCRSRASRSA